MTAMSEITERCRRCRRLLLVPTNAKTIRCGVCSQVSNVSSHENPFRRAKNYAKRILIRCRIISGEQYQPNTIINTPPSLSPSLAGPQLTHHSYSPSSVHGKKKALLIGITYTGKRYQLKGTANDVVYMNHFLQKFGFKEEFIVVLTEQERDRRRTPTRENMLIWMEWLVKDCQAGDSLVFHFSGHGSQQLDVNGDELDGFDETLCPTDYETNGVIVDDEINAIMVRPIKEGVTLHAIVDACHSGTALDLPYLCKMDGNGHFQWIDHGANSRSTNKNTKGGLVISFSGCDDHQSSADTSALAGDITTGAMTYAFIQAVERKQAGTTTTYGSLLFAMRATIREAHTGFSIKRMFQTGIIAQEPQLCSSDKFDVYKRQFTL